jgi:predicted PurR-regulated permease PerM
LSRSAVHRGVTLLVALAFGLAGPSAALAKGSAKAETSSASATTTNQAAAAGAAAAANPNNPLSAFPQPQIATTPTQTAPAIANSTTNSAGSSSLSGNSAIVIAVGALVVLGLISFFIWRDARRRAPVTSGAGGFDVKRSGSKAPPKPRKLSPAERRRRKRGRARR